MSDGYPQNIFEDCKRYTFNIDVIDVLNKLSLGIFPPGVVYSPTKYTLTCEQKNITTALTPNNPAESMIAILNFLKEIDYDRLQGLECNIPEKKYVHVAKIKKRAMAITTSNENNTDDTLMTMSSQQQQLVWSDLKKESKEKMFYDYIFYFKNLFHLTTEQTRYFESRLGLCLQLHAIADDDIVLNDRQILDVKCVKYISETKSFVFPPITGTVEKENGNVASSTSRLSYHVKKFINRQSGRYTLLNHLPR